MRKPRMISFRVTEAEEADFRSRAARRRLTISELLRRYGSDMDTARGIVNVAAYPPMPVTCASGTALEYQPSLGRLVEAGPGTTGGDPR